MSRPRLDMSCHTPLLANEVPVLPAGVRLRTMANGMDLILLEDRSAPVVSVQAWCKTGSIHEASWLGSGVSHLLEHMLFKGTTRRGAGRIDQEVQAAGGYMNAYTSFDRTVYYINVPSSGARVAIDILCDVMQNATLPPEELAREKQVILREMDMNQDDPARRSSRRLFETAYTVSPYRFTIIGYPDIFNELQPQDVRAYYRDRYAPNNLFLVVVGDIAADEAESQIRQAMAEAKAKALAPVYLPEEPPQIAAREVIEEAPIELSHLHFSWHIPDLRHPDMPVLDVLATLLGSGRSSRLFQQVREKNGLVHSIDAWTYSPGAAGLFGMSAMTEARLVRPASQAMLTEIEHLKDELISAAELDKAVKQYMAGTLAVRKTMQGQAQDLGGNWLAAGDLNFSERYLQQVKAVTPDDLQRAARHYLTTANRTHYALLPSGHAPSTAPVLTAAADMPIRKIELPNGLRILLKEDHRLPFVEFRAVFKGGVLLETEASNGLTLLLSKMLLKGTHTRSAEELAREIESVGGHLDAYGGNNSLGVSAEVMKTDFHLGLSLVTDVLLNPSFPAEALELEKEMQLATIKALRDQVLQSASRALRRGLFGNRGYGLDLNGSETSIPAIGVADLVSAHQRWMVPNNCVLSIFGDIDIDQVSAQVAQAVASWAPGAEALPLAATRFSDPSQAQRIVESRDKNQAVLFIGYPGVTIFDTDRFALELLQEACSDLGSRLFMRIREELGLAYYTGAENFLGLSPGFFAFYAGTTPKETERVESEILHQAECLRQEGLAADELSRAKAKLIGHKKIARQDLGGYALTTALDELYGLGYANTHTEDEQFEAVSDDQVIATARNILRPETMVVAIVKPLEPV